MVGIRYTLLNDLNRQAVSWCNKVNGKVHAATNRVSFDLLRKEALNPLKREYIMDRTHLRRVQKDGLISFAASQYSVPSEYVGKDMAVVALDNVLAAYHNGRQIATHRISYQSRDMVINPHHYRQLTMKQTFDTENTLFEEDNIIDFPIQRVNLSVYDERVEVSHEQ